MKNLFLVILSLLMIACTNQPKEDRNVLTPFQETELSQEPWEATINRYKADLVIEPNLDTMAYFETDKEYFFKVLNVPVDSLGLMINTGSIMKTDANQFRFRVKDFRDSATITIFADIDTVRHTVHQIKKKIGK